MKTIRQIIGGLILSGALWLPAAHAATGMGISPIFTLDTRGVGITTPPQNQTTNAGSNVTFTVTATGVPPFSYQWYFNNSPISGATGASLTVTNVQWASVGNYSVFVWNAYGSSTSASATLAPLTDGSNGNKPVQISVAGVIVKESGKNNLVIVTHGWLPSLIYTPLYLPPLLPAWVTNMAGSIQSKISSDWQVVAVDWSLEAWTASPFTALDHAKSKGAQLGKQIAAAGFQQVHLIAHSAGSGLIQTIADQLVKSPNPPLIIQSTFLDPFLGYDLEEQINYGKNANWSDCYFADDEAGGYTSGGLVNAYNVDVSWVDPSLRPVSYGTGVVAYSFHGYPWVFYQQTIDNKNPNWCGTNYGFALAVEKEGIAWNNNSAYYPTNNLPLMLNIAPGGVRNPNAGLVATLAGASFIALPIENAWMGAVTFLGNTAASLVSASMPVVQSFVQSNGVQPHGGSVSYTNTPAWLAVGVTVTNAVNLVQFTAGFNDTNSAEGLLTVYWNTNQIGMADERAVSTNSQTYHFMLPATVTSGAYTLSFRLDSFNGTSSSVVVTNVSTGFIGVTNPITLGVSLTNGLPRLQLIAPTNYNYLVQSSTNLINWQPTALLVNTNGTILFTDTTATNSPTRFYRVLMQ
jgi:hypothetical protein